MLIASPSIPRRQWRQHEYGDRQARQNSTDYSRNVRLSSRNEQPYQEADYAYQETDDTPWYETALVIIGAAYTVFAILQWNAIRRQASIARSNTDALINSERAWILLTRIETPHPTQKMKRNWLVVGSGFDWSIKNCGKTPAFIVKIGARFHPVKSLSELPKSPNVDVADLLEPTVSFPNGQGIGPGESVHRYTLLPKGITLGDERYKDHTWVAYGIVLYRTIFDEKIRETHFCYVWDPTRPQELWPSPKPPEYTKQT